MFLDGKKRLFAALYLAVFCVFSYGGSFDKDCVACHSGDDVPDLESFYFRYLLKAGSKKRAIEAMQSYLKSPTPQKSLLPPMGQKRFGLHPPLKLQDNELKSVLTEYFERYSEKSAVAFD